MRGGSKYVGEFKNDEFEGKGILTEKDGSTYEGQFKDGKMHGSGVYKSKISEKR
jgi:hypothetical protein